MNTTNCIVWFQPTISALHFRKKQKPTNFGVYFAIMLAQYTVENWWTPNEEFPLFFFENRSKIERERVVYVQKYTA